MLPSIETILVGRFILGMSIGGMFMICLSNFLVPSKMGYLIQAFGGDTALSGIYLALFGIANTAAALLYTRLARR